LRPLRELSNRIRQPAEKVGSAHFAVNGFHFKKNTLTFYGIWETPASYEKSLTKILLS